MICKFPSDSPLNLALIIAHQDDEVPIAWLLDRIIKKNSKIEIFCMTSGSPTNAERTIETRNNETYNALNNIGILKEDIHFIGHELNIPDGALHEHLNKADQELQKYFLKKNFDLILTLCNEGGHQDHDCCNHLSRKIAKRFDLELFSFSLYNGFGTSWKFFKTNFPIPDQGQIVPCKIFFRDIRKIIEQASFYPSQKITWFGLFPILLLSLLKMKFYFQNDNLDFKSNRPHAGPLLYERYRRCSHGEVNKYFEQF